MKLLFTLEETAKIFGVSEKRLIEMLGIDRAKAKDKLKKKAALQKSAKASSELHKTAKEKEK
jgi:hypothetical protein